MHLEENKKPLLMASLNKYLRSYLAGKVAALRSLGQESKFSSGELPVTGEHLSLGLVAIHLRSYIH